MHCYTYSKLQNTHDLFYALQMDQNWRYSPTPEGVTLTLQQMFRLNALLKRIVKDGYVAYTDVQTDIGGFYHARMSPCGSIMTVKKEDPDQLLSQTDFIVLSRDEFEALFELYPRIQAAAPALKTMRPCYLDHDNQEAHYCCPECNPGLDYPMD